MPRDRWNMLTRVIHGEDAKIDGAINLPVFQSSTFMTEAVGRYDDVRYTRLNNNPNQLSLARKIAALESTEGALVTASGMAAITTALLGILKSGDHVLFQRSLYGGTHGFVIHDLPAFGIAYNFIDAAEPASWAAALRPETRAIYVESMTNPTLEVIDFSEVITFANNNGLITLIDNTFASPVNFRPAAHGFDLVLHSCTKYINGHSDVIAGAIAGRQSLIERILPRLNRLGGSLDPHACFLVDRGMKTMGLRVAQHNKNALAIAKFLANHPKVKQVNYPGLESHPAHAVAKKYFTGFGGMLSFEVLGGAAAAMQCIRALQIALFAPSLGSVESLVTLPAQTSHIGMTPAERKSLGISDGLVRLSVGIEDTQDLLDDLSGALAGIN